MRKPIHGELAECESAGTEVDINKEGKVSFVMEHFVWKLVNKEKIRFNFI